MRSPSKTILARGGTACFFPWTSIDTTRYVPWSLPISALASAVTGGRTTGAGARGWSPAPGPGNPAGPAGEVPAGPPVGATGGTRAGGAVPGPPRPGAGAPAGPAGGATPTGGMPGGGAAGGATP